MTKTHDKWDIRFLELARLVAGWSKDPSTQVGCVLVNPKRVVVGLGYNGFPRGVCDHPERLENRELKYQMVQHAEPNAILNASADVEGCTAYVTHAPCANCTGVLIQAGVTRIVTQPTPAGLAERFAASFEISGKMLNEANVPLDIVDTQAA
jgi:dCMP deaminase